MTYSSDIHSACFRLTRRSNVTDETGTLSEFTLRLVRPKTARELNSKEIEEQVSRRRLTRELGQA